MFTLIFVIFISFTCLKAEQPQIHLPIGSLTGRERVTATGVTFYSYQGIPFGEPPVGPLRFQASTEKRPWSNILDATKEGNPCFQMYKEKSYPNESEDCLFINVYTPVKPSSNESLPVMFWIYGGAYSHGVATESSFGADHLVSKDVIVVEANYRVGPFGFLYFGDEVLPGNAGLKDQLLALQWTQKYIQFFGGDPKKVTIFGQSAGAASVSYHLLSPRSKGLFSAAILESGSALSPFAYNRNESKFSHDMAKLINEEEYTKHNSTSKALLEYLQSLPADVIDAASVKLSYPQYIPLQQGFLFAPVIERDHPGAFITKKQYQEFETGSINHVPVLMGFTSEELIILFKDQHLNQYLKDMDADSSLLNPLDMNADMAHRQEIGELIRKKYCPNGTFAENPRTLIKYMSDQCIVRPLVKQAQLQSKYGQVYFYRFAYKGSMTAGVDTPVQGFSPDVGHEDELNYIFACQFPKNTTDVSIYPDSDILVHKRMVTLWSNFAKYHNPTPARDPLLQNIYWPLVDTVSMPYLDIGSELEVSHHPQMETLAFWEELYHKYGVPPYDTY